MITYVVRTPYINPRVFDNAVAAFDFLADELIEANNAEYVRDTGTIEFSNAAYDCENVAQSGIVGADDYLFIASDGGHWSVTVEDRP